MKLKFSIDYRTEWGQQLFVALRYRNADGTERSVRLPMQTLDGEHWTAETAAVESRRSPIASFTYYYTVEDSDGHELRREWTLVARNYAFDASKTYVMTDQWRDIPLQQHLYTNAYAATKNFQLDEVVTPLRLPFFRKTIVFRVSAPQLEEGQQLAIIGSHPALGSWSPVRYLPMQYAGQKDWMISVNADALLLPLEYKYVIIDESTRQLIAWEEGDNRTVEQPIGDGEILVLYGDGLHIAEKVWRAAGVSIPVFSLRSEHSYGVGDFGDLYRMVDWAVATGMKIIQLLPVNDTTCTNGWNDSHPYNIVSAFALHPHYIDLEQTGTLSDKKLSTQFHRQQRELNALPISDYEAVSRVKGEYLKLIFQQQGEATLSSEEFLQWFEPNKEWLNAYAEWKSQEEADKEQAMKLVFFTQYHLHRQLLKAANHAHSKGVLLMGDLPIGVNGLSAETWQHPELFNQDYQTGMPPDHESSNGQNWGFPTYCWGNECEAWLDKRMRWMEQYFDALRIDHILGFFRTWQIPSEQCFGTMGHYSPSMPFTAGEIEYNGLPFRKDFLTTPFINDHIVKRLFGIHAQYVRDTYLTPLPYGLYQLKEEVANQRKIQDCFKGRNDENSLWIRNGLYQLVANVLFLEDPQQPEMYHPRIAAYREPVFEALNNEERDAYMRLYNNYFYQRHGNLWGYTGYQRLSRLTAHTRMLVCAEDLGPQPDCVPAVLDALRILTLEIQRMPKQSGNEFSHLDGNPIRSVATIATHDMPPLRLWWQENAERAQRFYATMLQKQGRAPEQLPAHLAEEIIARHLYSPSMLCILSFQDWMSIDSELRSKSARDERINTPSDPFNHWQYRMHITIEQLLKANRLNDKLKTMIVRSKR